MTGVGTAALAFRLLPQLSPALQIRRLMMLTLLDLRRLTRSSIPRTRTDGKAASTVASLQCRNRPSLYSVRSYWRHFR